ncbi:MAG: 3'-5' exonuclease [Dethiobacter sp.]|jgi:DNA polymerase-3 subunit epsilon|nr:3'-5' exonuclease [Dethiobacter sp.]
MKNERITTYTVIDVETPSSINDSICSIGIVHVRNNMVVSKDYYLINPECKFDRINMEINKISKSMVIDKPIFPEVWEKISNYFSSGVVVAHNAAFDLNVIGKTLKNYMLQLPKVYYICTLELARCTLNIEGYNLKNICNHLDIELVNHHNALSDAIACQKVFSYINNKYPAMTRNTSIFQLKDNYIKKAEKQILIKSLSSLHGIITGITSDINDSKFRLLEKWICEYDKFSETEPYNIINPLIKSIISNKTITSKNKESLINISRH